MFAVIDKFLYYELEIFTAKKQSKQAMRDDTGQASPQIRVIQKNTDASGSRHWYTGSHNLVGPTLTGVKRKYLGVIRIQQCHKPST
jgi:hypothetical protein